MISLFLYILFFGGILAVVPLLLFIRTSRLTRRIEELESKVAYLVGDERVVLPEPAEITEIPPVEIPPVEPVPVGIPIPEVANASIPEPGYTVPSPTRTEIPATPPRSFVFTEELLPRITEWLQRNWFFAVAASSLGLAGVFLVLYGIEKGILTPQMRVLGAILLGGLLIGAGEYLRRRFGDEGSHTELIPSTFSGAGLVSIFAGLLAARLMYGLIGPEATLIALVANSALAVVLGWFYGPFLAIVGVIGALASPFLVGGSSESAYLLHFYFAVVAGAALAIDSFKRWAWLSTLSLIGAYGAALLNFWAVGNEVSLVAFAIITAIFAVVLPEMRPIPRHSGNGVFASLVNRISGQKIEWPTFPTRIAAVAFCASTGILFYVGFLGSVGLVSANLGQGVLYVTLVGGYGTMLAAAFFWMRGAPALRDLVYFPAIAGLGSILFEGLARGQLWGRWIADAQRPEIDFAAPTLALFLGGAVVVSVLFAWRSSRSEGFPLLDAIFASAYAPVMAIVLELFWRPSYVLGSFNWALYLVVPALVMTVLSERFSRRFVEERLRIALFAMSALVMVSFMAVVLLSSTALTFAFSVLIAAAAWLSVKFNLPLLHRYVQIGVLTVAWRLIIEPGLDFADYGPIVDVLFVYGSALAALAGAYWLLHKTAAKNVLGLIHVAGWTILPSVISVLLAFRYFQFLHERTGMDNREYAEMSVIGVVWLLSSCWQLYLVKPRFGMPKLHYILAGLFAVLSSVFFILSTVTLSPLNDQAALVQGYPLLNALVLAYIVPAAIFGIAVWKLDHLPTLLRQIGAGLAVAFATFYIGLEIRHVWQGAALWHPFVLDGELYSYTVAMLLAASGMLAAAFIRKSPMLRKLALLAIAVTVAKVYLIDMSGLAGLLRVASFLALGLVLAAMAWVNRILQANEAREK